MRLQSILKITRFSEGFFTPLPAEIKHELPFFTPRLNLSQFSVLGCFSITNWRNDSQMQVAGDSLS